MKLPLVALDYGLPTGVTTAMAGGIAKLSIVVTSLMLLVGALAIWRMIQL